MSCTHPANTATVIRTLDPGVLGYEQAYEKQLAVHEAVLSDTAPPTVILVEHPPVITISQRKAAPEHLLADAETLARMGIDVEPTNRGGDITYHGPGQLVAYPILRLNDFGLNVSRYMRLLEQVVIDTVGRFGVTARRVEGCTGVWTRRPGAPDAAALAKLAALGIRVRRGVTLHGLALNVTTDLSHFETIVPCGLVGKSVTSLRELLGERCPTMPAVKDELVRQIDRQLADRGR